MQISRLTLYRIILGDFDFVGLRKQYPIWGPIYFIIYVFIGFFILLNMFMAIMNDAYSQAKDELSEYKNVFMLSDYFKLNYAKIVDKMS